MGTGGVTSGNTGDDLHVWIVSLMKETARSSKEKPLAADEEEVESMAASSNGGVGVGDRDKGAWSRTAVGGVADGGLFSLLR